MLFQALTLSFVIFTSLVGTFFVAMTLFELFLSDEKQTLKIVIDQANQDNAEYILRSALLKTNQYIEVNVQTSSPDANRIVELLAGETSRIKKLS